MYVALKPGFKASQELEQKVSETINKEIGPIARPKNPWIVTDMPKTRSGKIMRRVIAGISNFSDLGDVSTLANPEIVDEIRHQVQRREGLAGRDPARALGQGEAGDRCVRLSRVAPNGLFRLARARPRGPAAARISIAPARGPRPRSGQRAGSTRHAQGVTAERWCVLQRTLLSSVKPLAGLTQPGARSKHLPGSALNFKGSSSCELCVAGCLVLRYRWFSEARFGGYYDALGRATQSQRSRLAR
jgi:hypothetical protein